MCVRVWAHIGVGPCVCEWVLVCGCMCVDESVSV